MDTDYKPRLIFTIAGPVIELDEVTDELDSISEDSMMRSVPGTPATGSVTKDLDQKPPSPVERPDEAKEEPQVAEEEPVEVSSEDVISATGEKLNIGVVPEERAEALDKVPEEVAGVPREREEVLS